MILQRFSLVTLLAFNFSFIKSKIEISRDLESSIKSFGHITAIIFFIESISLRKQAEELNNCNADNVINILGKYLYNEDILKYVLEKYKPADKEFLQNIACLLALDKEKQSNNKSNLFVLIPMSIRIILKYFFQVVDPTDYPYPYMVAVKTTTT